MVSLDISVQLGNPTWPNPEVLTLRTHSCALLPTRERVVERDRRITWHSAGTYLRSRGRSGGQQCELRARNCPSASALIECLFLSVRISYRLMRKVERVRRDRGQQRRERRCDESERRNFYTKVRAERWRKKGVPQEGHRRRRRRLTILGERDTRDASHINNYCYSVMTDVGHGKTR